MAYVNSCLNSRRVKVNCSDATERAVTLNDVRDPITTKPSNVENFTAFTIATYLLLCCLIRKQSPIILPVIQRYTQSGTRYEARNRLAGYLVTYLINNKFLLKIKRTLL